MKMMKQNKFFNDIVFDHINCAFLALLKEKKSKRGSTILSQATLQEEAWNEQTAEAISLLLLWPI